MEQRKEGKRRISVVIPGLNEADSAEQLLWRLDNVAKKNAYDMQVIYIDDGSTDKTEEVVCSFEPMFISAIDYLSFRKNYGKSMALSLGAKHANEDVIITMDADLQDQPEEFPRLLKKIDEGYDVVSGWKRRRQDSFFGKTLPSRIFNWLVRRVLKTTLKDINCGLKAYRREVWDEISVYGEFHRFIPALAANRGFTVGEIEVEHRPREHGLSKYGAGRFVRGVFDLLSVFFLSVYRYRPLHFFGVLGGVLGLLGVIGGTYLTILWFAGHPIGTRPLLQLSVLLVIIGVQVMLFGFLSQLQVELLHGANKDVPTVKTRCRRFGGSGDQGISSRCGNDSST